MKRTFSHFILFVIFLLVSAPYCHAQHSLVNKDVKFNVGAGAYVIVPGDVVNATGSSTINNDGNIFLTGNFTNNASVVSGNNSNVKLEGGAQTIGGSSITTFGNLIIDGSADKTIDITTKISNTLRFNANHVFLGTNDLTLLQNAGISGAFNNKYVVTNSTGSLVRKNMPLSGDSLFAVGTVASLGGYKPVLLNYTGLADTFAVRVEAGLNPTTTVDPSCVQYTYVVEESNSGGTNASMSLGWNTADEGATFVRPQAIMWQNVSGFWTQLAGAPGAVINLPATDWAHQTSGISDFSANANRFIVSSTQQVLVVDSPQDSVICSGNNAVFTVTTSGTPPYTYQWQSNCGAGWSDLSNSSVFSGVNSASLAVTGGDISINGCQYQCIVSNGISFDTSSYATLFVNDFLVVGVTVTANPPGVICPGTNVVFDAAAANGGLSPTYQWQLNAANVGTNSSTYSNATLSTGDVVTCNVTSSATCVVGPGSSNQVTIILDSLPVADVTSGTVFFCEGSWVNLSSGAGTGVNYQWLMNGSVIPGDTTSSINASLSGNYSVVVSNNCGIDTSVVVIVNELFYPVATISNSGTLNFCQNDSLGLFANASSGYSYQWQYNGNNIPGATDSVFFAQNSGNYSVIVTNPCGTMTSLPVTATMVLPPSALITALGPVNFCSGGFVTLASSDTNLTYQWQLDGANITGATNSTFDATQAGSYSVIATNPCGTNTSSLVDVTIYQTPTVNAGNSVTIFAGQSTNFDANASGGTSPYTYSWSPFSTLDNPLVPNPVASPVETTIYSVVLTDINGCTSIDTLTVYIDYETDIFIPSGFSPNGDNENDVLYVRGHGIEFLQLIIYDRWGEKVFEATDPINGWDGTYKGEKLDPGVFVYYLKVDSYNGKQLIKQGNITLVR